jgi:hypothetical protein
MYIRNRYNEFTDSPVDEAWFLKFNVLFLPTDHRKILNRQPLIGFKNGRPVFLLNLKVMSN